MKSHYPLVSGLAAETVEQLNARASLLERLATRITNYELADRLLQAALACRSRVEAMRPD